MKQEKSKDVKIDAVNFTPDVLPPTASTLQDSFRYGKNIEKLDSNSIAGSSGRYARGQGVHNGGVTGNQSFTGIGFKPKMVKINGVYATSNGSFSMGSATSPSDESCVYTFANPSPGTWSYAQRLIWIDWSGTGNSYASLVSMDNDGFTINWVAGTLGVNFDYECYG